MICVFMPVRLSSYVLLVMLSVAVLLLLLLLCLHILLLLSREIRHIQSPTPFKTAPEIRLFKTYIEKLRRSRKTRLFLDYFS